MSLLTLVSQKSVEILGLFSLRELELGLRCFKFRYLKFRFLCMYSEYSLNYQVYSCVNDSTSGKRGK